MDMCFQLGAEHAWFTHRLYLLQASVHRRSVSIAVYPGEQIPQNCIGNIGNTNNNDDVGINNNSHDVWEYQLTAHPVTTPVMLYCMPWRWEV